jgi:hypothetical protein
LNRFSEALPIINRVRTKSSDLVSQWAAGASDVYKFSIICFSIKDYAMKALMFERRLEFVWKALDFDLWCKAEPVLNAYPCKEKTKETSCEC